MVDREPAESGQPQHERLERPAGSSAWRVSAVLVALLLVGVVVLGRMGMEPTPMAPAASLPAAVLPTPTAPTPAATGPGGPTAAPAGASPRPADPATGSLPPAGRYADGVPLSVGGERVLRLPSALALPTGTSLLLGGWYVGPDCGGLGHGGSCPRGRFADGPADFSRRGGTIPVERLVEPGAGPRIIRGSLEQTACVAASCRPALIVDEVVWSGDPLTTTGPIEVLPLLSALTYAFPDMDAWPFRDLAVCPVPWPPQTYRSATGGPQLTLIFPTTRDRLDAQAAVKAGRALLLAEQGGECRDQMTSRLTGRWVGEANVMLLVDSEPEMMDLVEAALSDALAQSADGEAATPAPITTWQAIRRLGRLQPSLDLAPAPLERACVDNMPADTFVLTGRQMRLLAVFPTRAERRAFQRSVEPGLVFDTGGNCELVFSPADDPSPPPRWIAHRNVLVEFAGPESVAESVAEALRGTGVP
jgi:hypothetical protein